MARLPKPPGTAPVKTQVGQGRKEQKRVPEEALYFEFCGVEFWRLGIGLEFNRTRSMQLAKLRELRLSPSPE